MIEKIVVSKTVTIPSGIQYSNTSHFLSLGGDYECPEGQDRVAFRTSILNGLEEYSKGVIDGYFNTYLDFQKQRGAEGHRFSLIDGEKVPHVTDILSLEFPAPQIANLEKYGELGSALDETWKNFKRTNDWEPVEFTDSGLIKTTYKELFDKSVEWWKKHGKNIEFHEDSGKVYHPEFKYCGEYDLLGEMDGAITLFDVKSTKDVKGKVLEKYLCQLCAYALTPELADKVEQVCIISPWNEPIVEGNLGKYSGKFLLIRGMYKERYGI